MKPSCTLTIKKKKKKSQYGVTWYKKKKKTFIEKNQNHFV